jgi:hypothetical protein
MRLDDQEPTAHTRALPRDVRVSKGVFARAVGAFVPKVTATAFQKFGFHSAEIMSSWGTIVGAELARLTRPESIKWPRGNQSMAGAADDEGRSAGATLMIATDPAYALEISYRHGEIIDRINRYFGYRAIAQIKVHQVPRFEDVSKRTAAPLAVTKERNAIAPGDFAAALDALGRSVAAANAR